MPFYPTGGGGSNPYTSQIRGRRGWEQSAAPFAGLYGDIYGRIGEEEESSMGQLQELMGYNVGQLGKTMSSQMGRMNVPMAGGYDALARRFMAPMQTQMQNWMQTQKMPWQEKAQTALDMAERFYPVFEPHIGKDYWKSVLNNFMKEMFGGGK